MAFSERNELFVGDFCASLEETNTISFNLQRDRTGNRLSNIKDTFAESLQLHMSVLHQSICIFKAGLSSLNITKKYLMQAPNRNVKTTCNSKHRFT